MCTKESYQIKSAANKIGQFKNSCMLPNQDTDRSQCMCGVREGVCVGVCICYQI